MGNFIDLIGCKFGRLTVLRRGPNAASKHVVVQWWCRCECGNEVLVTGGNIKMGLTTSCGCWRREAVSRSRTVHGATRNGRRTPEYWSWVAMCRRCRDPRSRDYKYYGGRGINVCERWLGPQGFINFLSDMGPCPVDGTRRRSIDRINNDGDYKPSNCRWSTQIEQMRHHRKM